MRNVHVKSLPIIVTGAILSGMPVIDEREPYHIEQRQYEEPSKLTREITLSTATFVTGTIGLFDRER